MVKFASWNIRGLNDPLKQREVSSFVKSQALEFICLVETWVRAPNRDRIFSSVFPGWKLFHNYEHALLGRIWICGNPEKVNIDIIHSMDQDIFHPILFACKSCCVEISHKKPRLITHPGSTQLQMNPKRSPVYLII